MRGTKLERSPGVWRLRVYLGDDPVTGNPRQASRTFRGTKKQADTALAEFVQEASRGLFVTDTSTVAEFLDRWLEHISSDRSPTTIRDYRGKAKKINNKLGPIRLSKLTAQHLDRAYREWLQEGLNPTTVHHLHALMSAALNQGVKWGVVRAAVTKNASPPPLRLQPKVIPAPVTVHELVAAAERRGQPVLAAAIAVAITTGMRRGELLGLRWSDVHLDAGTLHVSRVIKHADGPGWVIGPTKTHADRRIALDEFTVAVLRRHRDQADERAEDACVTRDPNGYIFTFDPTGRTPMRPDSLSQAFGRLCAWEGLTGVTLQTLRHFSASVLVASGRDVRTIAGRLGHADASTTLRAYADMVEGRDRDAADFIGSLMAATEPAALDKG